MLSPKAVERREIGNPVSHLQSRKPFLGAIRILKGSTLGRNLVQEKEPGARKIDKNMPVHIKKIKKQNPKTVSGGSLFDR
jgi:hypothetical protein